MLNIKSNCHAYYRVFFPLLCFFLSCARVAVLSKSQKHPQGILIKDNSPLVIATRAPVLPWIIAVNSPLKLLAVVQAPSPKRKHVQHTTMNKSRTRSWLGLFERSSFRNSSNSFSVSECYPLPHGSWQMHQVVDARVPQRILINHHTNIKQCTCGKCNKGTFLSGAQGMVNYGPGIRILVTRLLVRQYVPMGRIVGLFLVPAG